MSRTKHHRSQRNNKCGVDFGARYNCDKGYHAGTGAGAKQLADQERRHIDKLTVKQGLEEVDSNIEEQQFLCEQNIEDIMYFEHMLFVNPDNEEEQPHMFDQCVSTNMVFYYIDDYDQDYG